MRFFKTESSMLYKAREGSQMLLEADQEMFFPCKKVGLYHIYDIQTLKYLVRAKVVAMPAGPGVEVSWYNPGGYFAKTAEVGESMFFCDPSKSIKTFKSGVIANIYRAGFKASLKTVLCIPDRGVPIHAIIIKKTS